MESQKSKFSFVLIASVALGVFIGGVLIYGVLTVLSTINTLKTQTEVNTKNINAIVDFLNSVSQSTSSKK